MDQGLCDQHKYGGRRRYQGDECADPRNRVRITNNDQEPTGERRKNHRDKDSPQPPHRLIIMHLVNDPQWLLVDPAPEAERDTALVKEIA
ncbi:MAG TPA: hypothetical protein VFC19_24500 [Candidatus Limnocylindrales bacterium]|nr:hypothetical protein [Candidatus Limnocylindrales bacterium]